MKHIFKSFGETKRHPFIIATLLAISTIGLFMTTEMTATQAQSIKQPTTFSQHKPAKKPTKTNQTTSFNQQRQAALTRGNVPTLWSQGYQGQGMVIAVIDSGIQNHPDLRLSNNQTAKISKADAQQLIAQKGMASTLVQKSRLPTIMSTITMMTRLPTQRPVSMVRKLAAWRPLTGLRRTKPST